VLLHYAWEEESARESARESEYSRAIEVNAE
jgi:hypothetical protein